MLMASKFPVQKRLWISSVDNNIHHSVKWCDDGVVG